MFSAAYGVPPKAAVEPLGTGAQAYYACGGSGGPAHWYGFQSSSVQDLPGLVVDQVNASWVAALLDASTYSAQGEMTGTLLFSVPSNGEAADASGYTVRLLVGLDQAAGMPAFEWQGLSVAQGDGGVIITNSYTGQTAVASGAGTLTQPALPFAPGMYTTFSFAEDGTAVYVGPYLWAAAPGVRFAPGSQGASTTANRLALNGGVLYDLQIYTYAFDGSVVEAASFGYGC